MRDGCVFDFTYAIFASSGFYRNTNGEGAPRFNLNPLKCKEYRYDVGMNVRPPPKWRTDVSVRSRAPCGGHAAFSGQYRSLKRPMPAGWGSQPGAVK
jgi:hypothetical protein